MMTTATSTDASSWFSAAPVCAAATDWMDALAWPILLGTTFGAVAFVCAASIIGGAINWKDTYAERQW